jgi:hypothetical protein
MNGLSTESCFLEFAILAVVNVLHLDYYHCLMSA